MIEASVIDRARSRKREIRKWLTDRYHTIFLDPPRSVNLGRKHDCDACSIVQTRRAFYLPFLFGKSLTFVCAALCEWCSGDEAQKRRAVRRIEKRGWGIVP